jgi:hypothetical protein
VKTRVTPVLATALALLFGSLLLCGCAGHYHRKAEAACKVADDTALKIARERQQLAAAEAASPPNASLVMALRGSLTSLERRHSEWAENCDHYRKKSGRN